MIHFKLRKGLMILQKINHNNGCYSEHEDFISVVFVVVFYLLHIVAVVTYEPAYQPFKLITKNLMVSF